MTDTTVDPVAAAVTTASKQTARGRWGTIWAGTRATFGALMGLAPHLMHHVGFLAGAALLTGLLGNTVLYAAGLLLSIPMLRRLGRRFRTWKAPAIGVIVFTSLFAVSAFVIGPLFNPPAAVEVPVAPAGVEDPDEHTGHHG